MATKREIQLLLNRFAVSEIKQATSLVTCGFELETQETEGHTADSLEGDGEIDHDSAQEAIWNEVNESLSDTYDIVQNYFDLDSNKLLRSLNRCGLDRLMSALDVTKNDGLRRLCKLADEDYDSICESVEESISQDFDYSDYRMSDSIDSYVEVPEHMEATTDGSVRGFEFRTVGGLRFDQFITAAKGIFEIDHEIDTKCSFHIHLQIPGIHSHQSPNIVRAATEYLLNRQHMLPESVRERFANQGDYYAPSLDGCKKYSFVHMHDSGTWEFRCFGNVQNAIDAETCLIMAIRALRYAYRVEAGICQLKECPDSEWLRICERAMDHNIKFSSVLKGMSEARKEISQVAA